MRQHGTRARYVIDKCRCEPCTTANRLYGRERDRQARRVAYGIEPPNPAYIDATEARNHLRWLATVGVGRRQVHQQTGVAMSAITKIRDGKVTKARPHTIDRILAVGRSNAAPGALIDAKPTWRKIRELQDAGYTNTWIARQLGSTATRPALQIGKTQVTAATARKVNQLHYRTLFRQIEQRRQNNERRNRYRQTQRQHIEENAA